jgi:hypothetical protein
LELNYEVLEDDYGLLGMDYGLAGIGNAGFVKKWNTDLD